MASNCGRCTSELTELNSSNTARRAKWALCRSCDAAYHRENYSATRRAQVVKWGREHPESRKSSSRKYSRGKYGTTVEEFEARVREQGGLCRVCNRLFVREDRCRRPCQDHDHETGKNREIICGSCNLILGLCDEQVEILASAIQYLRKHKATQNSEVPCVAFVQPVEKSSKECTADTGA